MKTFRLLTLALSATLTTACSVTPTVPSADAHSVEASSITGKWVREGPASTWEGHRLDSVDGKKISFGFALKPYVVPVKVEPGPRKLVVLALFNVEQTQYSATIPMDVVIKPSTAYTINAAISGSRIESWLEIMDTGEVASDRFRGACRRSVASGVGFWVGPCVPSTQLK